MVKINIKTNKGVRSFKVDTITGILTAIIIAWLIFFGGCQNVMKLLNTSVQYAEQRLSDKIEEKQEEEVYF